MSTHKVQWVESGVNQKRKENAEPFTHELIFFRKKSENVF